MFADDSETLSQTGSSGLVQLLTQSLQSAQQTAEATVVPSLLIPRRALPSQLETDSPLRIEDQVLAWFWKNHFEGDRVRKNPHGYPGLFRELCEPPPWVEVTIDDVEGQLTEARARELRPLYVYFLEQGEKLLGTYQEYLALQREQFTVLPQLLGSEGLLQLDSNKLCDLERKIKLACLLGSEGIESLYEAILPDFDEYSVVEGAPDLFLWHPDPAYNLWFFAEVKGPGDHLRESQAGWIQGFWEHVRRRVVILHVY